MDINYFADSIALSCAKLMWEMGSKNPVKVIKGIFLELFFLRCTPAFSVMCIGNMIFDHLPTRHVNGRRNFESGNFSGNDK